MDAKLIESLDAKLRRLERLAQKLLPLAVNGTPIMECREMLQIIEAGRAELDKQSGASDHSRESSSLRRVVRVSSRGWWLVYRRYPDGAEEKVALVLGKKARREELAFNRRSFVRGKGVRHYARKASDLDFAWWAGAGNSNDEVSDGLTKRSDSK